uniref:Retrovirus-related Pol polyprotein from transposon TNT 1-94 n=1 Tax=Cajanus cajan TaxID=3821 RepID=A0A151RV26_CAJCA|nr:Retrovirus-related Pol polyprotein from transposon TNT 1-94 [Cajanus cajan]
MSYPAWKVQLNALLVGYDLIGLVDGQLTCPAPNHRDFIYWRRQDQLTLHAIISSVDQNVITLLGNIKTSKQAWDILNKRYASKTRARIMHLKERLSRYTKGSQSMTGYLHGIKSLADELAIINSPLDDVDLVIHTINGLGDEYKEVSAVIRTRENPIGFEELHDLLSDAENYHKRDDNTNDLQLVATAHAAQKSKHTYNKNSSPQNHGSSFNNYRSTSLGFSRKIFCQYCDKPSHTAKVCYKLHGYPKRNNEPAAHHARTLPQNVPNNWILDSGATHHITNDLDNLHLTNSYRGQDQVIVGDGTALPITHTGTTILHTTSHPLQLKTILHVPTIAQNLLDSIIVDYITYHPPSSNQSTSSSHSPWHHILGHPSERIFNHLISLHKIKAQSTAPCVSCSISKSHKLPFSSSSLHSKKPLDLVYTDVWGPTPVRSLDGFLYYLIFVDHFSKYVWLFPLKNKSDVSIIFPQFKNLVEKYFNTPLVSIYSDNGGEFLKLKHYLSQHGISHFTTPRHTPELNATAERRHRHIVET